MCTCAFSMQQFPSSQGSWRKSTELKTDEQCTINLQTSQMQWSPPMVSIFCIHVRFAVSQ